MCGRAAQGGSFWGTPDNTAELLGAMVGFLIFVVGPGVLGYRLLTSHRREVERWRQQNGQR